MNKPTPSEKTAIETVPLAKASTEKTPWFGARSLTASLLITALVAPFAAGLPVEASAKAGQRVPAQATRGGRQSLNMERSRSALPQSQALTGPVPTKRSLGAVKPPRSNDFYESSNSKEAEYERLVDEEIKALFKLSQQNRRSQNRGEIWLRLGERYVEKARLIEFRAQAEYDKRLKDYIEKKTTIKPKIEQSQSREYNTKAVQLYEWFVKDFPKDPKVDQALFFLGYNQFELGNTKLGEEYYVDLTKRFPNSAYVTESHFALGEYYFENEKWERAYDNYAKVVSVKKARLNTFALYKASWCLYRMGQVPAALKALERVVRMSRAAEQQDSIAGRRAVNKVRLAAEALKDYVPFYAEAGDPSQAVSDFQRVTNNDEKQTLQMLERLAFTLADAGNRTAANKLFKQLISMNPTGERSAEYQYQVVLAYATSDQKEFRKELEIWLESFGPKSYWANENEKNQKLVGDVARLQETTLRNNVLQLHQTAQNSRAEYSQKMAATAYNQYLKYFPNSPQIIEMQFFHAELLFDMGRHEDAAKLYFWVADNDKSGQYREKAIINTLLALEKDLPDSKEIEERRGKSLEKIPLDPPVARFEKAALRYIETFPKGDKTADIQRRMGVLYYSYNHFDEANVLFEKLLRDNPKSGNAEIAGNLMLDSYKLRNDMIGFAEKGQQLLAIPGLAGTKFGTQIRGMMEKATYMRADEYAAKGESAKAAKEFETFASSYKSSELAAAARFKAAQAYEKAGDLTSAIRMHALVLASQTNDLKMRAVQNDSRNALARIYQQTGQLEQAAKAYHSYAEANPKDQKAINGFYNAGVLWDALGESGEAMKSYQAYIDQSRNADRVEALFAQAGIQRKRENGSRAVSLYDQYLKSGPRSEAHAIEAAFMIADLSRKQGRGAMAKQWYQRTIEMQRKAGKAGREAGVKYAAEARFQLAQDVIAQLTAVKFTANDKQQAQAAAQVKSLREKYINEMKDVIRYDNAPFIIAALASTGQMFDSLAQAFNRIPVPSGFSGADAAKYKELIQGQINGLKTEAKNSYKAAIDKSQELEAYTPWTKTAQLGLAAIDPAASADAGELTSDARAADWMGL